MRSSQNRTRPEVDFTGENRRSNLRGILPAKSELVRRAWVPSTSLVTSCGFLPFRSMPRPRNLSSFSTELPWLERCQRDRGASSLCQNTAQKIAPNNSRSDSVAHELRFPITSFNPHSGRLSSYGCCVILWTSGNYINDGLSKEESKRGGCP